MGLNTAGGGVGDGVVMGTEVVVGAEGGEAKRTTCCWACRRWRWRRTSCSSGLGCCRPGGVFGEGLWEL